jgi:hypothetical protein
MKQRESARSTLEEISAQGMKRRTFDDARKQRKQKLQRP